MDDNQYIDEGDYSSIIIMMIAFMQIWDIHSKPM